MAWYWWLLIIAALAIQVFGSWFFTNFGRGRRSWPIYVLSIIFLPWKVIGLAIASAILCLICGLPKHETAKGEL